MKYGAVFIAVLATLFLIPIPTAEGQSEQSQETGVAIRKTLENEQPNCETIVEQQLKRREAQIELARIAEETRKLEEAEKARKARETVRETRKIVRVAQSFANAYTRGQCTWFVASRRAIPSNWGNARAWLANAQAAGFGTGSTPQVGAIAWTGAGSAGHVALVVAVQGSQVTVQEMNYNGVGVVSTRVANASSFRYIY